MKKLIISTAIVLVIVWSFYYFRSKEPAPTIQDFSYDETTESVFNGENSIAALNQKPTEFLKVSLVILKKAGFAVIHQMGPERAPGAVIGQSEYLLPPGGENIIIRLDRPVLHGEKLFAVLYDDDGDKRFDVKIDKQIFENDLPAMARFMISDFAE